MRGVNLNSHVTRILNDHVEIISPAIATGMFLFPKKLVSAMLKELDEATITRLSKQMAERDFVDLAYLTDGPGEQDSFIKTLLAWTIQSGFAVQDNGDGNGRTIILKHDMGKNWSTFMAQAIKSYLETFKLKAEFEVPGDILLIKMQDSHA